MENHNSVKFITLLFSFISFFSCNDNENDDSLAIKYSRNQMSIDGIIESIIPTGGSGQYTAWSSDENVASVEMKETDNVCLFNIIPLSKGNVTITISDGINKKETEFTVVEPYIPLANASIEYIIITSDDKKTKEITQKIKSKKLLISENHMLMMQKDNNSTFYIFNKKEDIAKNKTYIAKGNYSLDEIENRPFITLHQDDQSYLYEITGDKSGKNILYNFFKPEWLDTQTSTPVSSKSDISIKGILFEDFTQEFIEIFPGIEIESIGIKYTFNFPPYYDYPIPVE